MIGSLLTAARPRGRVAVFGMAYSEPPPLRRPVLTGGPPLFPVPLASAPRMSAWRFRNFPTLDGCRHSRPPKNRPVFRITVQHPFGQTPRPPVVIPAIGAFFVNYQIKSPDQQKVLAAAAELVQMRAYISPPANDWITLYDEVSENQDALRNRRPGQRTVGPTGNGRLRLCRQRQHHVRLLPLRQRRSAR